MRADTWTARDQMNAANAAGVERLKAAGRSLSEEAIKLSGLVGQFQLGLARGLAKDAPGIEECVGSRCLRAGSRGDGEGRSPDARGIGAGARAVS